MGYVTIQYDGLFGLKLGNEDIGSQQWTTVSGSGSWLKLFIDDHYGGTSVTPNPLWESGDVLGSAHSSVYVWGIEMRVYKCEQLVWLHDKPSP